MSTFNDIHNALNLQLSGISGLPDIYYPNAQNSPAQGNNWIRPTLLPAKSTLFTLANENMHSGIYQVDIFTSLKKGSAEINTIADAIRTGFNRQSFSSNGVTVHSQAISISPIEREEAWCHCFVEIEYICINT